MAGGGEEDSGVERVGGGLAAKGELRTANTELRRVEESRLGSEK